MPMRWMISLCAAAVLSGCATGQDSLVAMSPSGEASTAQASPSDLTPAASRGLLAVSGSALLPGSDLARPPGWLGAVDALPPTSQPPAGLSPAMATLSAATAGAQMGVALAAPPLGPLLSMSGPNSRLTGGPVAVAVLGRPVRTTTGVGLGPLATAPTQLTVSVTAAASQSAMGGNAPMVGPRLPITANPAVLAGLAGILPITPGRN